MMSRYLGTYFAYKAYAVVRECTLPTVRVQKNGRVSIARYEKVRADLIAINHRHQTVIVETKSCPADFRSDEKWESYLPLCNKFYFAADPKTAEYIRAAIVERKAKGVGVIAVETVDRVRLLENVRFIRPARSHECLLEPAEILWHMALRGSGFVFPGRLQCGNSFIPTAYCRELQARLDRIAARTNAPEMDCRVRHDGVALGRRTVGTARTG